MTGCLCTNIGAWTVTGGSQFSTILYVSTLGAPDSISLNTGRMSVNNNGVLYTRAAADGIVRFEYGVDGISNGGFGWFNSGSNPPGWYVPQSQCLGFVSDLVSNATASFSVAAGDYFGFTISIPEGMGPFDSHFRQALITNFSAPTNAVGLTVNYAVSDGGLVLYWSQGILQSSDNLAGGYTNVLSATSPYTIQFSTPKKFYRIRNQ